MVLRNDQQLRENMIVTDTYTKHEHTYIVMYCNCLQYIIQPMVSACTLTLKSAIQMVAWHEYISRVSMFFVL